MSEDLGTRFVESGEDEARGLVATILSAGGAATLAESLIAELAGDSPWRRGRVLERLMKMPEAKELLPHFAAALHENDRVDRRNGARSALTVLAAPASVICADGVAVLADLLLKPKDSDVRLLAAAALGESGNARARGALEEALRDTDVNVSSAAAEALGMIRDQRAVPALLNALETSGFWTRAAAVMALGTLRDARAVPALVGVLDDPLLGSAAAAALGDIESAESLEPLAAAIAEAETDTRSAALDAVAKIFAADPSLEVSKTLRRRLVEAEPEIVARFTGGEDLLAARLLGLAASDSSVDTLLAAAASEEMRSHAEVGLNAIPYTHRADLLLPRLGSVGPALRPMLVRLLPPLGTREALLSVIQLLADGSELRGSASQVLGESDPELVWPLLLSALHEPELRTGAAIALSRIARNPQPFVALLADPDPQVRAAAADGLGRSRAELPKLAEKLGEETDPLVRQRLLAAIGQVGGDAPIPLLVEVLREGTPGDRFSAAAALGCTGSEQALDPLLAALTDPVTEVRIAAIKALGELGNTRAATAVEGYLSQPHARDMRRMAARAFDRLADSGAMDRLALTLDDPDPEVRLTAVAALDRLGSPDALRILEARADTEEDGYVRSAVTRAIVELRRLLGLAEA